MKFIPVKKRNDGFTLIEVMIAVVVLAIFTLPLMGYFTHALTNAAKGKRIQKCEMAAQSILEEVNSFNTYEQIDEAVAATGSKWSVDGPDSPTMKHLKKKITIDGDPMIAKVSFDFDYKHPATPSAILYNDYQVPEIKTLYNDSSVVGVEGKQFDTAVSKFYYKYHKSTTKDAISMDMQRNFYIEIAPADALGDILNVKVFNRFTYKSDTYDATPIVDTEIPKSDFRNLYLLYDLHNPILSGENLFMKINGLTAQEAQKINIYLIKQKSTISDLVGPGYMLNIQSVVGSTTAVNGVKYFTNGYGCNISTASRDIITHATHERIAHVTVDIYKESESEYNANTRLVQVTTSKGE